MFEKIKYLFVNKNTKFHARLADGEEIYSDFFEMKDKGVILKVNKIRRFIPYQALLWVDTK